MRVPRAASWKSLQPLLHRRTASTSRNGLFEVHEEVEHAIQTGRPVVALETTIYTHGFPYPENVALASRLELLVRANGGVPATIGILNGVAKVGMEPEELIQLVSTAGSENTWKISRRDLGFIGGLSGLRGQEIHGGTTISGTMILAHLAGIKIFATGGLGGVHRGGENSLDISADLTELGRTPVCVISSGCKSFLDLPRTLEYLETQGVGVATFADGRDGQVDFPAFFSRDSGVVSPRTIQHEADAAAIVHAHFSLHVRSGLLFANPVPATAAMAKEEINHIIDNAVAEAERMGIRGAANTPFVLKRIRELSNGGSVTANRALIEANVIRGTKVAVELSKLQHAGKTGVQVPTPAVGHDRSNIVHDRKNFIHQRKDVDILVIGALAADTVCDYTPSRIIDNNFDPIKKTSNPAQIYQSPGGVGRNVATAAQFAGAHVSLASVVADDIAGTKLLQDVVSGGLDTSNILTVSSEDASTAQYVAINNFNKDLVVGMADFNIFIKHDLHSPQHWGQLVRNWTSPKPKWIVVDDNWHPDILYSVIEAAKSQEIPVAYASVSGAKAGRLFQNNSKKGLGVVPNNMVSFAAPNAIELAAMHTVATGREFMMHSTAWWETIDSFGLSSTGSRDKFLALGQPELVEEGVPQQMVRLLPYIPNIVTNIGERGSLLAMVLRRGDPRLSDPDVAPYILSRTADIRGEVGGIYMRLFRPPEVILPENIVSVNGIGDSMFGVLVAGLALSGKPLEELIPLAQRAAAMTLKSQESVSPEIRTMAFT